MSAQSLRYHAQVPLAPDVDFARLAEQELTGSNIKAAAFFACAKASTVAEVRSGAQLISLRHLLDAIKEVQASGKQNTLRALFT